MLVALGSTAKHCAFCLISSSTGEAFKDDLKDYHTGQDTVRFQEDDPLLTNLVRKLVRARIAENTAQQRHTRDRAHAVAAAER